MFARRIILLALMMLGLMAGHFMLNAIGSETIGHAESSQRSGSTLDSTGGPDSARYFWVDNQGADTATFNWIELAGTGGTRITTWTYGSQNDGYYQAALSFLFPFYGNSYTSLKIGTNGNLQFTTSSIWPDIVALPMPALGAAIMPFACDLATSGTGVNGVWFRDFSDHYVVEWDSVIDLAQPTSYKKFEAILFPSGKIKFQYAAMNYVNSPIAVGIQGSGDGPNYLQYYYSTTSASNPNRPAAGRAIWFYDMRPDYDFAAISILSPLSDITYDPDATIPISVRVKNLGRTADLALVSYTFNAEIIQSEQTAVVGINQTADHVFDTPITAPTAPGSYPLKIWVTEPWDGDHSNDTVSTMVNVYAGTNCETTIVLVGNSGNRIFYNCSAGNNTPGQPCGQSGNDLVFRLDVPVGNYGAIWQTYNDFNSRHTLSWGGDCPGSNLIGCIDDPDTARLIWYNTTGSAQPLYFVVGSNSNTGTCGEFSLHWEQNSPAYRPVPPDYFENFDSASTLPAGWVVQNVNGDGTRWYLRSNTAHSAPNDIYIYYGAENVNNDDWIFTPLLTLNGGEPYILQLFHRIEYSSSDRYEIKYGTAPYAVLMTTTIVGPEYHSNSTYRRRWATFTPPTTGIYCIGFHSISRYGGTTFLDDIRIASGLTYCVAPDSVRIPSQRGAEQALLTTTIYGGLGIEKEYQWYHGVGVSNPDSMIAGATDSTYTTTLRGVYSCKAWWTHAESCAAWDSAMADVVICATADSMPYRQGFENYDLPGLPACWSRQNGDEYGDYSPAWGTCTYAPRTGRCHACVFGDEYSDTNDWLFSPGLQMTAGVTYVVDYCYRAASSNGYERMAVAIGRAQDKDSMGTALSPLLDFSMTAYTRDIRTFTPTSSGLYYVGWHALSDRFQYGIFLDDITIYPQSYCTPPDSVRVPAVRGDEQVILAATSYGGYGFPAEYQWYHGVGVDNPDSLIPGATSATYTTLVSGVFSCRGYYVNSTACMAWDSAEARVLHCNVPEPLPYSEGFEGLTGTVLPDCWTTQGLNSNGRTWQTIRTTPRSGTTALFCPYVSTSTSIVYAFLPAVELTAGQTYTFEYWYRQASTASEACTNLLEVRWGTTPVWSAMTGIVHPAFAVTSMVYSLCSSQFTPETSSLYYLGICGSDYYGNGMMLDDCALYPSGSCAAPENVQVAAVSAYWCAPLTARVNGGAGGPAQYQWYHGLNCNIPDSLIAGANSKIYATIQTGIYTCKAWRINEESCTAFDSAYGLVRNCTPVTTLPLHESFDGSYGAVIPVCWTVQDVNEDTHTWSTRGSYSHSGTGALDCRYSFPGSVDDWLFLPRVTLLAGHLYELNFWYRTYFWDDTNHFEIRYGAAPHSSFMTHIIRDIFAFTNTEWLLDSSGFCPDTTGGYFIGIHAVSRNGVGNGSILLDDVDLNDAGVCANPCDPAISLTVYLISENSDLVRLTFLAPETGTYVVYSSTFRNNDGDPRGGDPQWTIEATINATAAGRNSWSDPNPVGAYKNYVVIHDCAAPPAR